MANYLNSDKVILVNNNNFHIILMQLTLIKLIKNIIFVLINILILL